MPFSDPNTVSSAASLTRLSNGVSASKRCGIDVIHQESRRAFHTRRGQMFV
jgi:hypothetical protein